MKAFGKPGRVDGSVADRSIGVRQAGEDGRHIRSEEVVGHIPDWHAIDDDLDGRSSVGIMAGRGVSAQPQFK